MKYHVSVLALAICLAGCSEGGGSDGGTTTPVTSTNTAPTVTAGGDQTVTEGANVQLDGSATDADGDTLTITWTQLSGTSVSLSSTNIADPVFTAPDVSSSETLEFEISVSDGTTSSTDTVSITVQDSTPAVNVDDWIINTTERSSIIDESSGSTQGVTSVSSPGPDIGADVTSLSGNPLVAEDGFYYEDYVYSGRAA
ncbi:MAG: PKD domain-containing protein, partial [Pseudomonadota bacterium]